MKNYQYQTPFQLTAPVLDLDEAKAYLDKSNLQMCDMFSWDMEYDDEERIHADFSDKITSISWMLNDALSGSIRITTDEDLTEDELSYLSKWVEEQSSDGIGEGFRQQSFASYSPEKGERVWGDEMDSFRDDFEDGSLTASFVFPDGCRLSKAANPTLMESDLSFAEGLEFPCERGAVA